MSLRPYGWQALMTNYRGPGASDYICIVRSGAAGERKWHRWEISSTKGRNEEAKLIFFHSFLFFLFFLSWNASEGNIVLADAYYLGFFTTVVDPGRGDLLVFLYAWRWVMYMRLSWRTHPLVHLYIHSYQNICSYPVHAYRYVEISHNIYFPCVCI